MRIRFTRLRPIPVLLVLLVCLLAPVRAQDNAGATRAPTRVVYAGDADYPPYDLLVDDKPTGFDVELFRAVAAHAGLQVDYRLDRWDRVVADLHAGRVDVVPMLVTPERARRVRFSEPFLHRYHLVFGRRGGSYVATLDSLVGRRVAVQSASLAWEELRRIPGVRLLPVAAEGDALVEVQRGRADYALVPMFIGYEALQRHGLREVVSLSPPLLEHKYAFAVPPDRAALLPRINAGLRAAVRSGEKQQLYLKWLANLTPPYAPYRSGLLLGAAIAVPLLAAALVLLVWWRRARQRAAFEAFSRAQAEARAEHLALHDPITQLANRHALRQSLEALIERQARFAAIRIELLELESVEAIAGHAFAEQLLLALAQRLQRTEAHGPIGKLSDNAFLLVSSDTVDDERLTEVMRTLMRVVSRRIEVGGVPFEQPCCAGAARYPDHARDAEELLRAASVACSAARRQPGSAVIYHPALVPDPRNLTLLTDLRKAIREQSLGFALQPKLDLASRRLCGAELLVRWDHPAYGPLPPSLFVPLAERTEVIGEMTLYLVAQAVRHCAGWRLCDRGVGLSVNVSANDLCTPDTVDGIIELAGEVACSLTLEITETAMLHDPALALAAVRRLRTYGMRISLDDFGTGHASLSYLRQIAPDEVKIDRSFTAGIFSAHADQAIVRATIRLAHDLGAKVTAEGVEDARTLEWLADAGCDAAQGFHIARPLPASQFIELVAGGSSETPVASRCTHHAASRLSGRTLH